MRRTTGDARRRLHELHDWLSLLRTLPSAIFKLVALIAIGASAALGASSCGARSVASGAGTSGAADPLDGGYGGGFPAADPSATTAGDDNSRSPSGPSEPSSSSSSVASSSSGAGGDDSNEASDDTDGDAGTDGDAADTTPDGACTTALGAGDLTIDEIMIESVAGAGDDGEWFEVSSSLDCVANLNGLHGECPKASKVATFDVTSDTWLPARGTFVVADSNDPAINHRLPGLLLVWLGHQGDVLRNQGSTITLTVAGVIIDTVTYPSLPPVVGASIAFPSGCDPSLRADFTNWKRSTASWFPGFLGTPNAPNSDVECP